VRYWRSLFCFLLFIASLHVAAQKLPADSTKPKKPSTRNDTWHHDHEPETAFAIDSTLTNLEEYNVVQRNGKEYIHAGNTGSAAFPLVYEVNRTSGFNLGYNQFDIYRYVKDSVKYYEVVRPYAELTMLIGLRNEQMFMGRFANQHKKIIRYGVDFRRIFSKGGYTNQRVNSNCFNAYGIYSSKNGHWKVQADFIFNAFKAQENGGVTADVFDTVLFRPLLAPVNLQEAENNYRQIDFHLKSSYSIGKKYQPQGTDSTTPKALMPWLTISHHLNVENNKVSFRDRKPDADYYGGFYLPDSVFNDIGYTKLSNAVEVEYGWRGLGADSSIKEKNLLAKAEAGYDYYWVEQNLFQRNLSNLYVGGVVRNNAASGSKLLYRFAARYYMAGWNRNDLLAEANAGYDFGKWGILTANFTLQWKEMPYVFERYTSHPLEWTAELPKMRATTFGGKYQNTKWGVFADVNYFNVKNVPIYPLGAAIDQQAQNFIVYHAANRHAVKGFHFDNDIWFTQFTNAGVIKESYPLLFTRHSVYYERRVFKGALWLSTGFDVRFLFQNNAPYYDPLMGVFYPVNVAARRTFPVLDFFLNFKIKTVRVMLKVDNISSMFGTKGYYMSYLYPAQNLSFRVGITWRFFE
jgi:hypothetical protein